MRVAIIVAGGSGERFGRDGGKQLALVAGRPVLAHSVAAFAACDGIDAIVVVAHPERVEEYRREAVEPVASGKVVAVIAGGDSRQASVAAGLAAVPRAADVIVIHDGARPLVTPSLVDGAIAALEADAECAGVVVGHPAYDTLKLVDDEAVVVGTVDRSAFWVAQTPQVFRAESLRSAYARVATSELAATDDASLVERDGGRVRMFAGPRDNLKVTVAEDLAVVEALLASRERRRADG